MDKVLYVDGDASYRKKLGEYLRKNGYEVYLASSVCECRQYLKKICPELILSEVSFPDGNGIALCEELRLSCRVPFVFYSEKDSKSGIVSALRRGGDDYILKPCEGSVLCAKMEAIMRRARLIPKDYQFRYGALRFDTQLGNVFCDGEVLNVTKREYAILLNLAKYKGQSVDKDALYEKVWGQKMLGENSALWTAMSRLKKKVENYEQWFEIESCHDGYALKLKKK